MSRELHEAFVDVFEGRVLKVERIYNHDRSGFTLALHIFIPDTTLGVLDELEIYRRVAQVVNVISPR